MVKVLLLWMNWSINAVHAFSLSVANQTEQDTHKHTVCMKLEIYAQTLTKYINLQAEWFFFLQ